MGSFIFVIQIVLCIILIYRIRFVLAFYFMHIYKSIQGNDYPVQAVSQRFQRALSSTIECMSSTHHKMAKYTISCTDIYSPKTSSLSSGSMNHGVLTTWVKRVLNVREEEFQLPETSQQGQMVDKNKCNCISPRVSCARQGRHQWWCSWLMHF